MSATKHEGLVRVCLTHEPRSAYPEQYVVGIGSHPLTGVCFSGGSTRSYAAAIGQLRGLTELGLIPRVTYISSVSGGAWAAAAYTFYAGPGGSDAEILGAVVPPEGLSTEHLVRIEPASLGYAATLDFQRTLRASREDESIARDQVWNHAIGETFLAPYGLFDPDRSVGFTLSRATYEDCLARNPGLRGILPHTVRDSARRSYLLVHATLNWPTDIQSRLHRVGFEFSPLAVGSPQLLTLRSDNGETHRVGGGFVETLAHGCSAPTSPPDERGLVKVTLPPGPVTLADAIGASSAFSTTDRDLREYPHVECWPVTGEVHEIASGEVLSDGGDIENYGLIPLLRRRVTAVVVFINTVWPLSLDYDPTTWPETTEGRRRPVDPFLAPLFGAPSSRFPHNQVFAERDFASVVSDLQSAKRAGRTLMALSTHTVQANTWWGISGGWDVRICWVYNDRVHQWEDRLPSELQDLIEDGQGSVPAGPVANFPHYLTRGQNAGRLIQLTPVQVNLLSHLTCWTVTTNADQLNSFLS